MFRYGDMDQDGGQKVEIYIAMGFHAPRVGYLVKTFVSGMPVVIRTI